MTKGPQGQARVAETLGADDPRIRRGAAAKKAAKDVDGKTIAYDAEGRLRLVPGRSVMPIKATLSSPTTLQATAAKVDELIAVLRDAGVIGE